jgi:hypothetical protein
MMGNTVTRWACKLNSAVATPGTWHMLEAKEMIWYISPVCCLNCMNMLHKE